MGPRSGKGSSSDAVPPSRGTAAATASSHAPAVTPGKSDTLSSSSKSSASPIFKSLNQSSSAIPSPAASVRSRGQQARRNTFSSSSPSDGQSSHDPFSEVVESSSSRSSARKGTKGSPERQASRSRRRRSKAKEERPLLGGLTFLDLIFIAVAYAANLLKTLGVAELFDIGFKAVVYCLGSLPFDFYRRWTLSHPKIPPLSDSVLTEGSRAGNAAQEDATERSSSPKLASLASASQEPNPSTPSAAQLSPFHHLVILLTKFACSHFPHLLPRVLFAEDTMLPFVGWRTGGASWSLMREMHGGDKDEGTTFKAIWIGSDAYATSETRRKSPAARSASTLLYLHGGGFSLGSVSFYAEALLRILNKVIAKEGSTSPTRLPKEANARCVAVEYDLSPAVRFPDPLLQCLRCYAHLVEIEKIDPESITIGGDSAGANLAMGMLLVLTGQAKGQHAFKERDWTTLPLPGQAVLISPWVDLRPKAAHAFAHLREDIAGETKKAHQPSGPSGRTLPSSLTTSMLEYDWDYVAAETLLHFAQVYAGVIEEPRRVIGPLGWLAHICGVLSQGLQADVSEDGAALAARAAEQGSSSASKVIDPARRLAKSVKDMLEQPLFESLAASNASTQLSRLRAGSDSSSGSEVASARPPTQDMVRSSSDKTSTSSASFTSGLQPLFPSAERKTRGVSSTSRLYRRFDGDKGEAAMNLDHNLLLSPTLGDWTKVKLKRGCLVTWGERERLSADIETWVKTVQSGCSPTDASRAGKAEQDKPSQDGQEEAERKQRAAQGKWLKTAVEHGPGGVHAWPFVAMYLAGTDKERERGIDTIAEFIARDFGSRGKLSKSAKTKGSRWPQEGKTPNSPPQNASFAPQDRLEDPWQAPDSLNAMQDDVAFGSPTFGSSQGKAAAGRAFTEEEYKESLGLGVHFGQLPPSGQTVSGDIGQLRPDSKPKSPKRSSTETSQSGSIPIGRTRSGSGGSTLSSTSSSESLRGSISRRMEMEYASGQVSRGRRVDPSPRPPWWASGSSDNPATPDSTVTSSSARDEPAILSDGTDFTAVEGTDLPSAEIVPERGPIWFVQQDDAAPTDDADNDNTSSPPSGGSAWSAATDDSPSTQSVYPVGIASLSPSYFGLSYALRRDTEGLSDIAEESSVLSGSYNDRGDAVGSQSPVGRYSESSDWDQGSPGDQFSPLPSEIAEDAFPPLPATSDRDQEGADRPSGAAAAASRHLEQALEGRRAIQREAARQLAAEAEDEEQDGDNSPTTPSASSDRRSGSGGEGAWWA